MERLIELFINTENGEFYDRGGLLAAYDPAINAGELVRLTVQLCAGVPAFNPAGALLNPDTTFAGTLAAAETIIDNNFNWYDKGTLLENLTTGTAISELSVASEAAPRQLGAVRLNAGTVVNFCGWTATEGGYRLTLADNEFNPAQFTPTADFAHGAALEVLEQPIIVSAQNDDSGRATGLFTGLLDAANPVYESMIEGHEDIPNCRIEFSIYQDGRAVFRARRYFDCLGAMAMNKGAAYVHSDSWREADSRYIKLVDWQAPPEYQFSEDGTNWHDQQQNADLYYHERRPGGQWGPAVKMKTGPTGAAAGFGAPTVTVETLPAGSDATASVAASGDNTAKVFNFNFGIPKGADGKNGTDGKAGADGADGVSSYTYVAYASDASGADFSLTPSNALKFRAEIHTTTAIETPDVDDFTGATWVKYIGDDGAGAGDMTKAVYDTNDDGIVDHAATADTVGTTTAAQVADAVGKAHTHANKATLDKFGETDGKPTYDGAEIGGASSWNDITDKPSTFPPSAHNHAITDVTGLEDALQNAGSVKSVNNQLPDESGNVTVETGGVVDESRLLPALDSVPVDRSGNPLVFKAVSEGMDEHTLLYCPFDADFNDHSAAGGQFTQTGRKSESITTDDKKFGAGGLSCGDNYNTYLSGPLAGPVGAADCTIHFWAKFNELNGRGPFALLTAAISKEVNFWDAAAGCIALSVYSNFIRLKKYTNGNGNASTILDASVALSTGVWHHFAVVRSGSTWHLFVDGELIGTGVNDTVVSSSFIRIGGDGEYTMNGLIDEFIVLDYAKWITDFEPPTQPATTLIKSYEVSDKGSGTVKSVNGQTPDSSGVVTLPAATVSAAGLMAAADKAAIAGLTTHGIYPNALAKSGAVDFNEVIDHGLYFIGGDTPHLNYPETYQQDGGTLQVIRNGNYLTQTLILFDKNKSFNRSCFNANSGSSERTFSAWQRLLTDADWYSQRVTSASDFNEYKTPGGYFFYTAAHLNSPDAPNNTAGWLVIETVSSGEYVKQTYYALNARKTYIRTYNNNNHTWLPWHQQLSIADITEFKDRPGYFKLPGGIIVQWGAVLDVSETKTFDVTLPLAFPHLGWVSLASGTSTTVATAAYFNGANALKVVTNVTGAGSFAVYWIAIGY